MNLQMDETIPIVPVIKGDQYFNWIRTPTVVYNIPKLIWHNLSNGRERKKPEGIIPVVRFTREDLSEKPSSGLTLRWLGHSSLLLEMNGYRWMIDPMLSTYASPIPGFVKRYSEVPVLIDELPPVDFVLISHDHYDHLDKSTVKALAQKGALFFVPLGIENYLRDWGIKDGQIQSLNWWQEAEFRTLKLVCVPARHFSGRSLINGNRTLWAGWAIKSMTTNVFYSGDSGYANHFKKIGKTLGPFDLAIIENGAYNKAWPYVHSDAENAVQACLDVKGKLLLPVHWSTFDLSLHSWDEPIVRAISKAQERNIKIATPQIGELVDLEKFIVNTDWWTKVK
jgi:L-ascorbate metabolism protein UlaG (beta-lactamase superfamily)